MNCLICQREIPDSTLSEKHHLTPRSKKGKKTITVCRPCGDQIHQLFSNNELRDTYNTVEALKSDERMQKWIRWIRKTDHFSVCMKTKKKR